MASAFSITAASNQIRVEPKQPASSVTYTVTNALGQELRGRASLTTVPEAAAHLAWLSIEGESERPMAIGATEQFRVVLNVPADAAPGNYTLRLNMVATHNTDETFTEGPTITLTVPEPTPEPRKFPLWVIPVALVVVAIVAVVLVFALRPRSVTVPDVAGMAVAEALDELEALGLRPRQGETEFSDAPVDRVARTDPEAGSEVDPEERITVLISAGPEPTPTPTATPPPTVTPTATPDLPATATVVAAQTATAEAQAAIAATATAEAAIQAAIAKYLGTWERESGSANHLTELKISQDNREITLSLGGFSWYLNGSGLIASCFIIPGSGTTSCEWGSGVFTYAGDPMNVSLETFPGMIHNLTITMAQDGTQLFVSDQVSWQGTRFTTDTYVMEPKQRTFTLSEDIIFFDASNINRFIDAIPLPTATP